MTCIFCKIIAREAPATIVYQDELVTAFRDIQPVAPAHILIVPNRHMESVNAVTPEDEAALGRMLSVAQKLAKEEAVAATGYRLVVNTGVDAGQVVFHLHMHLLGGKRLRGIG
jgi:histidine triad (HIT) family protein